jgi:SAM-dependent MidA family methyltransferase
VEAGAGNGRLSADILRAARHRDPAFYDSIRLHLSEASPTARAAQRATLGDLGERLASSADSLPQSFEGVLIANELLDAMPVHQVVMRDDGLREVYVSSKSRVPGRKSEVTSSKSEVARLETCDDRLETWNLRLGTVEGPPSTPALQEYLDQIGVTLEPGWRVEINLRALEWMRDAARRLARGFMILIDYGHEARELYSPAHSAGTLTSFAGHRSAGVESSPAAPAWLQEPGRRDITAQVDFTSVRAAAEAEGMTTIGFLDQTYFLMGLLEQLPDPQSAIRNPQLKTLIMPGGLGSTHKVLILGKGVGAPALKGCSFSRRVT